MKNIYCIVGPSGSGKTTVSKILERDYGMKLVESYTTRPPRYPDEEGHIFVSDEEFDALGEMCAYTEYDGYRYGVTPEVIDQNDIYVIDPYGVKYLNEHYHGDKGILSIRIGVDSDECLRRMIARGDSPENAYKRLAHDMEAFALDEEKNLYEAMIPNYDFNATVDYILAFIRCWEACSEHLEKAKEE